MADIYNLNNANFGGTGGNALAAAKQEHEHRKTVGVSTSTTVTATDFPLFIARSAGVLISFEAVITGTIAVAPATCTIDLQRSTGGGAYATVLSGTITFSSADTARVLKTATISTTAVADGDHYIAVVTVVGGGTQNIGLMITLTHREGTSQ